MRYSADRFLCDLIPLTSDDGNILNALIRITARYLYVPFIFYDRLVSAFPFYAAPLTAQRWSARTSSCIRDGRLMKEGSCTTDLRQPSAEATSVHILLCTSNIFDSSRMSITFGLCATLQYLQEPLYVHCVAYSGLQVR